MSSPIHLPGDVLVLVQNYAAQQGLSLEQAAADLIRRGAEKAPVVTMKDGFAVFQPLSGAPIITSEMVAAAEEAYYEEEARHAMNPTLLPEK